MIQMLPLDCDFKLVKDVVFVVQVCPQWLPNILLLAVALCIALTICRHLQLPPHAHLLCFPALCICSSQKLHFPRDSHELAEAQPQMTILSSASGL